MTKLKTRPGMTGMSANIFFSLDHRLLAIIKPAMAGPPIADVMNNCLGLYKPDLKALSCSVVVFIFYVIYYPEHIPNQLGLVLF
jgi:hypothetical protein